MTEPSSKQPTPESADSKSLANTDDGGGSDSAAAGGPPKRKKAASKEDRAYKSDHKEASAAVDSAEEEQQFQRMIEAQGGECNDYWRSKYEKEAKRNWDIFYKQNETRFFKNRHYVQREFLEIESWIAESKDDKERRTLFEAGCGCGNTLFPLLQDNPRLDFFAADFSPRAVEMIRKRLKEMNVPESRCKLYVYDLTKDKLAEEIKPDFVTLMFVLSALSLETMPTAVATVFNCMKPGALLFLRDYALYDLTQLRFKKGSKIGDNFYVRGDGTRSYFFTTELIGKLFTDAGFELVSNVYVRKHITNAKEGKSMRRTWVQLKARKPLTSSTNATASAAASNSNSSAASAGTSAAAANSAASSTNSSATAGDSLSIPSSANKG